MKNILALLLLFGISSCSKYNKQSILEASNSNKEITFYPDEVKPDASKPCFQGAYYRKLVSSHDKWVGLNGTVVLPEIHFDQNRKHPNKPKQFLDNPSIYLGGNMSGQETDIGLAWEVIRDEKGVVSEERKAYRPFLRRTDYVATGQKAVFENAPAQSQYYWYPGEEVHMSVKVIANGKIRFIVEGAGKKFERDFDCDGYRLDAIGEFKRVNAIDQVANEGKPAQATETKVLNSLWKFTNLLRLVGNEVIEVPFHSGRYTEMACPSPEYFSIRGLEAEKAKGGESISISGTKFKN